MKWYQKIWEYVCLISIGIVTGIVIFIKYLDKPEYSVLIKKIKNKNVTNSTVDNNVSVVVENEKEPTKKELRRERRKEKRIERRK